MADEVQYPPLFPHDLTNPEETSDIRVPHDPNRDEEFQNVDPVKQEKLDIARRIARMEEDIELGGAFEEQVEQRSKLGDEFKNKRNELCCSIDEIEARSGISFRMICHIEFGFATNDELTQLIEPLCLALELDPEIYRKRIPRTPPSQSMAR